MSRLQAVSLKDRLLAGFVLVVLMFAALMGVTDVMNRTVADSLDLVGDDVEILAKVGEVPIVIGEVAGLVSRVVYTRSEELRRSLLDDHQQADERVRARLVDVVELELDGSEAQLRDVMRTAVDDLLAVHAAQIELVTQGDQQAAIDLDDQALEAFDVAVAAARALSSEVADHGMADISEGLAAAAQVRQFTLFGALVAAALAIGFGIWVASAVSHQVGDSAEQVARSSSNLSAISAQMAATAEETASQSTVVAAAGDQVSQNNQTVAAAVEQMTASVREISESANQASRVAAQAVAEAQQTNARIEKLGISSAEIGEVIDVITTIAENTNLLALNATIEAARAGEVGKGFAVVANEVKQLASQTAEATRKISPKIAAIQAASDDAVESIGRIVEVITRIADMQTTVASAVEEQTATTNEISLNITEAARGSRQIADNVAAVANAAGESSEAAARTHAAASELGDVAQELQAVVEGARRSRLADTSRADRTRRTSNGEPTTPHLEDPR